MKNKQLPSPQKRLTFNHRFKMIGLLLAAFASALLLTTCTAAGSVTTTPTYTTMVTGTVTTLPPGESSSINLPGAKVSALPPNPASQPVTSGPDGSFTLQVKHSGSFKLKVENACYDPFTGAAVSASADGSHNAGAISLTWAEPAGTDRYSITQKATGSYKLTVMNCVRTIGNNEFGSTGTIITAAAAAKGVANKARMITEIALPFTLKSIGERGLRRHLLMSGTLTIPRNVETLAKRAFQSIGSTTAVPTVVFETGSRLTTIGNLGFMQSYLKDFTLPENLETIESSAFSLAQFSFSTDFSPSGTLIIPAKVSKIGRRAFMRITGITAVDIRSDKLAKPAGATGDFPLKNNLFQNVTGITEIKLLQKVYDSYTKAELQAIFGSTFTNYLKPDGTAYDFSGKS